MTDIPEEIPECPVAPERCPVADAYRRLKAENKRLVALARIDELTGYYNFRHLQRALAAEMERTRRTGLETGVIIADLDYFKHVNDTYGHEAGNMVLKSVSGIWMDGIRQMDIACRYGGEEFVFILPGTRLHAVVGAAERLRKKLADAVIRVGGHDIRLTASFGVDGYRIDDHALSIDGLLDRADQHLLKAKRQGRNRVCYDTARGQKAPTEVTEAERSSLFFKPDH
ncbi:MAG: GGDEF domain-containing protein [Pseudomonadota bacterium]